MEPWGIEALFLDTIFGNLQGGFKVLDLHTWEIATQTYVTVLPMPHTVVDCVVAKGKKDGHKPLKFHTKRDRAGFLPAGLPAGVAAHQGYETLLATIEQQDNDESVWRQDSEPDDDDIPDLMPRQNNCGETIGSDSDSDSDDKEEEEDDDDDNLYGTNTSRPSYSSGIPEAENTQP